jgi:hypothetical protein
LVMTKGLWAQITADKPNSVTMFCAPLNRLEADITRVQAAMAEASHLRC